MTTSETPQNSAPQPQDATTENSATPVQHDQAAADGGTSAADAQPATASLAVDDSQPNQPVAVVGLGASAGGIKVIQEILKGIKQDSGLAFVVVMHLSPEYESNLAAVLQTHTALPVIQVTEAVRVEANHVYVIPPNYHIMMQEDYLHLTERQEPNGKRVAIDLFFRTLAAQYGQRAVCAVLSGSDSDGVIGLKHIKEQGGVTIAQDPDEAEYDSMPRTAIGTGMVDWVLPSAQMAPRLLEFARNEQRMHLPPEDSPTGSKEKALPEYQKPGGQLVAPQIPSDEDETALHEVLMALRRQTGHDFAHYKRATVLRRIARRMQVNTLESIPTYLEFMRQHPAEAFALLGDLLISVTNFFRDPEAFEALRLQIPQLFAGKGGGDQVRVWVCGCATGEEAYSIAMLLCEYAPLLPVPPSIQIFATDLDEEVIQFARAGVYPLTIEADVSPERLRRFFVLEQGRYRVRQELREMVLFATHNVLKDSPFSRLDLVTCRNLLIYLKREAQERVFDIFHFALHAGGLLFLGSSESIEDTHMLFAPLDKRHRLYVRRAVARQGWQIPTLPVQSTLPAPVPPSPRTLATQSTFTALPEFVIGATADGANSEALSGRKNLQFGDLHLSLLEEYAPPSVVVNENYDIVHLSEHVGRFFQLAGGEPTINLLKVVHPELRIELRTALFRATKEQIPVSSSPVPLQLDGQTHMVSIRVRPSHSAAGQGFILVVFEDTSGGNVPLETLAPPEPATRQLEAELQMVKEQLAAVVEQYEASTEELKASNEELQAMNEEMRSATEELQTSKEELQSVNEELITVNYELKSNLDELSHTNSDLQNLLTSTEIGTIFLDRQLCIKRFTPRVQELFNLIATDVGRPLSDITHKLRQDGFCEDAARVLHDLKPVEREVQNEQGLSFIARLLPYRTTDDRIDGVVLTFVDFTVRKAAEEQLRESEERFRLLVEATRDYAMFLMDNERRIIHWNSGAERLFGYAKEEVIGQSGDMVFTPEDRAARVPQHEATIATREGKAMDARWHMRKDGTLFWASGVNTALYDNANQLRGFAKIARDATAQKEAEAALQRAHDELEIRVQERTAQLRAEVEQRQRAEQAREQLLQRVVAAQEEERLRISHELHDQMGQQLTALLMGLNALPEIDEPGLRPPSTGQQVESLQKMASTLMQQMHDLAWQLRPTALDTFGLETALKQYIEEWSQQHRIKVDFISRSVPDRTRLSPTMETALYRVAQEALTNVLRHAEAKQVSMLLECRGPSIVLIIEDNGRGFETDASESSSRLGLLGMLERMELVNGTLTVESSPGNGTTVYARAPLKSMDEES